MRSDNPVATAVERYNSDPLNLVQIVHDAQAALGWLSRETQGEIAERLKIPVNRVESVVTFYSFFYDKPRGAYRLLISDNITDRMQGNQALLERLLVHFSINRGEVSADGLVSVDLTSCTGMCDQGPAMLVNNVAVPRLSEARIDAIANLIEARAPLDHWPAEFFRVEDNVRRQGPLLQAPMTPGRAIDAAIAIGREGLLNEMKRSNLRGRGGAGFTTGLKWEAARNAPGAERYIVCNADEGEPGAFKDRVLLSSHASRVFEGMSIAAYAVGATRGFLYLRGEYEYLKSRLDAELERMRLVRRLGPAIRGCAGFDFDVEIHVGAGAYVCGEETALLESLAGKPGRPRVRPPYPVTHGYLGRPTVVNNVETLCQATEVAIHGGAAFAGQGTKNSTGSKLLSVSGDCEQPGVYEYSFGVPIAQVLEDAGAARDAAAVQIGGPSGVLMTPDQFTRRIAFEDVPTSGSFMIFSGQRDMFEVARNFVHFFAHESCGFCTPCRVGTSLQREMVEKIAEGRGTRYEINELMRVRGLMRRMSHCGLGQMAGNAISDCWSKFRPTFERRLLATEFAPAMDLDAALAPARVVMGRDDAGAHLKEEV
ncbi:MAG: NAD(P)H-dependent oxidoreductase subunit E [Roseiarcus sp.]|jgi:[NiFe] hydrogenase diaphorase moiety large subunit|uniref:NAD(P)H-dependent oxidoreductase subunit E n=1 Tax=Roseiarcus sp. TaxID=1969460 RepID=UPI003C17D91F